MQLTKNQILRILRSMKKMPFQRPLKPIYRYLLVMVGKQSVVQGAKVYTLQRAKDSTKYMNIRGKTVLAVGCNTGYDCRYFIELGAGEVHGVDIIDEIGANYAHPHVKYHQMSVEAMDLKSESYDLVFSCATFEHVPRIDLAFPEMVRVTKPKGIIYCVADPLWNSRQGHHKGAFFENYPWIHLRLSRDEILEYCKEKGITDPTGEHSMEAHVDYMLDSKFFNKMPAEQYVSICNNLKGVEILMNELYFEDKQYLTPKIYAELEPKGYQLEELLAVRHTFIARKLK